MPTPQLGSLNPDATLTELKDYLVGLNRYLNYLLSSLDTLNISRLDAKVIIAQTITAVQIAAGTITADKMDVTELSAISADLGTITAGIINAVIINAATINIQDDVIIGNNLSVGFGSNNRRITLGGGFITYVGSTLTIDGAFSDVVINSASTITIKSLTDDINLVTNTAFGKHVYANTILLA